MKKSKKEKKKEDHGLSGDQMGLASNDAMEMMELYQGAAESPMVDDAPIVVGGGTRFATSFEYQRKTNYDPKSVFLDQPTGDVMEEIPLWTIPSPPSSPDIGGNKSALPFMASQPNDELFAERAYAEKLPEYAEKADVLTQGQFFNIVRFVLALTESLYKYGLPTHRLEYQVSWVAKRFGIDAVAAVFPSYITLVFRRKNDQHTSYTYNITVDQSWDLYKLEKTDRLAMKVASHKCTLEEGSEELQEIRNEPPLYKKWMHIVIMGILSFAACPLFYNGGLSEALISAFCGFLVGCLDLINPKSTSLARIFEALSAVICGLVAGVVSNQGWFGPVYGRAIVFSGLMKSMPALQINMAISDLATKMMVSGTSLLLFSFLVIFEIGFGMALGVFIGMQSTPAFTSEELLNATVPTIPIPAWSKAIFLPVVAMCIGCLLNSHWKQFPAMLVSGVAAWAHVFLVPIFGPEISAMFGQAFVVLVGNMYSRIFDRPSFIPNCIGTIMVVPANLGLRQAVMAGISADVYNATDFAFVMLITAVTMAVGGYLANMILFPKRAF